MNTATRTAVVEELQQWSQETGEPLPAAPEYIAQLEEDGLVVDLEKGVATLMESDQGPVTTHEPTAVALNAKDWLAGLEKNGKVTIRWRIHPDEWFALHPPAAKEEAQG